MAAATIWSRPTSIRSGKIAAYLELRDNTLVQAQAQIDQFAASMSSALSDKTTAGVAAPVGAAAGGLRRRPCRDCSPATSCTSPTRTTPPASRTTFRSCASTIRACCRWATTPRSIPTTKCSASISPAAWRRSFPSSMPRSAPAPTCNSRIRPARRCACWMTARRTVPTSTRPRSRRRCPRSPAAIRSSRCSPITARPIPARSPPAARSRPASPAASASIPRCSAIPRVPSSIRPVR